MDERALPRTVARRGTVEIEIKKSRFIGTVARAATEAEARAVIEAARKRFWDANHNCSAYRIGPGGRFQRSNDDGEPSGTAGAPMLAALAHRDLTDVVAVVTRYFGGTLLGAGGLVRAYGQAVSAAIENAGIVELRRLRIVAVDADYADAGRLENVLRASPFAMGPIEHGARATFTVRLAGADVPRFAAWLADASQGRLVGREVGEELVEVPVEG